METLEAADIPTAYFDVSDFDDYLRLLELCTSITGRKDLYEQHGLEVQRQIHAVLEKAENRGTAPKVLCMRASASMPLASRPVELEGKRLLDGGIADPIPLWFFQREGYERNVVVLTQPRDFVKKPDEELPLLCLTMNRYPRLMETLGKRHKVYNAATAYIRQQEQAGTVFVIAPEAPLGVGSVEKNPDELRRVYALGRRAAKNQLKELQLFLEG